MMKWKAFSSYNVTSSELQFNTQDPADNISSGNGFNLVPNRRRTITGANVDVYPDHWRIDASLKLSNI